MAAPERLRTGLRCAPLRHSGGFTLVELLVALFVLAVMAGMAWQGVDAVMRSREVTRAHTDRLLRLQSVLTQWEVDLAQAVDTQSVPAVSFDGAHLRITRLQDGEVRLVVWSLRGTRLLRWAAPPTHDAEVLQEAWMRSQQLLGDEPGTLQALRGVASWQLYFFDQSSSAWRNAQSSGDVQEAEPAQTPPATGGGSGGSGGSPSLPGGNPAQLPKATAREAMPDGVRLQLVFVGDGTAADGSGSITRDLRLLHP